jgi:PhnB protein
LTCKNVAVAAAFDVTVRGARHLGRDSCRRMSGTVEDARAESAHAAEGMVSVCLMTAPTPYLHLPGTARDALTFYGDVFGGDVRLHTVEEFGRTDGPADAVAHGYLEGGPVELFAADVTGADPTPRCDGITLALLGTSTPAVLRSWFARLSEGGQVVQDLEPRPWGATDGQVVDRYGLRWLIGFEGDESP